MLSNRDSKRAVLLIIQYTDHCSMGAEVGL